MTDLNLLGRIVGRFEIIEELGRGGMAVVYRARQTDLKRQVALKILPPEFSLDRSYIERFQQEANSAAALEHPHIVPIYEVGATDGLHYIAMKYIAGRTLKDLVQDQGALDVQQTVAMLEQVAEALDYAHSEGVIHRDIKPSNMMVEKNGWVYLTDFGLARGTSGSAGLTMAGTVMGTPEYMSPEQAQGLPTIGPPTDIYALGVVLYELLTGTMPFQADTPMGMLVARLQYAPRPPRDYRGDLPLAVEDVIMRALARKPEARFPSAREMIQALKAAVGIGTRSLAPQRPISQPQGTPVPPIPPQRPSAAPPPNLPTTQPAGTPPYVIPASPGPATPMPRAATPPPPPVTPAAPVAVGGSGAARAAQPGSRRGMFIAIGAIALVLIGALLVDTFVLRRGPDPQVAQGLARGRAALGERGDLGAAIDAYSGVLKAAPTSVEAHTQLALIYNLRDRYQEAEQSARAAIAAAPDDDSQAALAYAMLAEALVNQGEHEEALKAADQAIALDDDLAEAYSARASVKATRASQDSDADMLREAAEDAERAIAEAADEDNLMQALAHNTRGYVYWQEYTFSDNTDQAKADRSGQEFTQAIGLQGQLATFHSNLGYFYNAQGEFAQSNGDDEQAAQKFDLAVESFQKALDADPDYGHAHAGLGWNLYHLKDYEGALGEFDKAIAANPRDVDAYIGKSRAYQDQETPDHEQAIELLTQASQIVPKDPSVFTNLGWAYRSRAATQEYASDAQKESYDEAETQFRRAIELNENYVSALTGLGWVLQDRANVLEQSSIYEESASILERSISIKEDQAGAHNALGWSRYSLSQYAEAEESFRRATELLEGYTNAYYGLGLALEAQDKREEAIEAYQAAADQGSDSAKEALDRLK